jgi:carbon-monoxide dehydrogenase medium subunit
MKPFEYFEPENLDEALDLLYQHGAHAKVLAGGTDLIVQMKQKMSPPQIVIGLRRLKELDFVQIDTGDSRSILRLGPMTLLRTIASHSMLAGPLEMLREASLAVGDVQIRNVATLGGNIANASPSADMIPVLLALGAKIKLQKKTGERILDLENFFLGPFMTQRAPEEMITEIFVHPIPEGNGVYLWMPKRTAVDETLVGVSAWLTCDPEKKICQRVSLAFNSVSPFPIRAKKAEAFLQGKELNPDLFPDLFRDTGEIASHEVSPRSRADYRRRIVSVLTEKALDKAWRRIKNG